MPDGFSVFPERLRRAGSEMGALGQQLADGAGRLQAQVGAGAPWGTGEAGAAFGAAYTEALALAEEAYGVLAEAGAWTGENLTVMADTTEVADEDAAAGFTGILTDRPAS